MPLKGLKSNVNKIALYLFNVKNKFPNWFAASQKMTTFKINKLKNKTKLAAMQKHEQQHIGGSSSISGIK